MSGKESGYAGKVKNTGSQFVQAPFQQQKKSNSTVKRGEDLRTGSGGSQK